MKRPLIKRGFKAVKEEEKIRKEQKEQRQGKLWRVFFAKNADPEDEIGIRFLTDEPICFKEHTYFTGGKVSNVTCVGEGCKDCESGDKPRFVGAFLVIDRTEFEFDEKDDKGNKTGKKTKGKDRLKLVVRGSQDLAQLDRLQTKYGLLDRDWSIAKTGSDTSTKWNFDRGELDEWTEKELNNILPEKYRGRDLYEVVEEQIMGVEPEEEEEDDDTGSDVQSGVQSLDEEDAPKKRKAPLKKPKKK